MSYFTENYKHTTKLFKFQVNHLQITHKSAINILFKIRGEKKKNIAIFCQFAKIYPPTKNENLHILYHKYLYGKDEITRQLKVILLKTVLRKYYINQGESNIFTPHTGARGEDKTYNLHSYQPAFFLKFCPRRQKRRKNESRKMQDCFFLGSCHQM